MARTSKAVCGYLCTSGLGASHDRLSISTSVAPPGLPTPSMGPLALLCPMTGSLVKSFLVQLLQVQSASPAPSGSERVLFISL